MLPVLVFLDLKLNTNFSSKTAVIKLRQNINSLINLLKCYEIKCNNPFDNLSNNVLHNQGLMLKLKCERKVMWYYKKRKKYIYIIIKFMTFRSTLYCTKVIYFCHSFYSTFILAGCRALSFHVHLFINFFLCPIKHMFNNIALIDQFTGLFCILHD